MGFFKVNHNEASKFEPIPPGTYEAYISGVEKKTFSSGRNGLSLTLTIRDDVDQEARKRKVFDNLVSSENAMFRWQDYAKATEMPDGVEFDTEDAAITGFGKHLKGKAVKITIKHDTTRDRYPEQVSAVQPSELGGQAPESNPFSVPGGQAAGAGGSMPWENDPFANDGKPIDISDDDLPF